MNRNVKHTSNRRSPTPGYATANDYEHYVTNVSGSSVLLTELDSRLLTAQLEMQDKAMNGRDTNFRPRKYLRT